MTEHANSNKLEETLEWLNGVVAATGTDRAQQLLKLVDKTKVANANVIWRGKTIVQIDLETSAGEISLFPEIRI